MGSEKIARVGRDVSAKVLWGGALQGLTIFKLSQRRRGDLFMTDVFVTAVRAAGLTGFGRELKWDSKTADEWPWCAGAVGDSRAQTRSLPASTGA